MKISEFFALLSCVRPLLAAVDRVDEEAIRQIQAKVGGIHAQVDARKAAR